jgi:hypothetical protein
VYDALALLLLVTCVMPCGQERWRRDVPSALSAVVPALVPEKDTGTPKKTLDSQPRKFCTSCAVRG